MLLLRTLVLFILISSGLPGQARAQEDPTYDPTPHELLIERIEDAKLSLEPASVGTTRVGGQHAVLAAWNSELDDLRVIHVRGGISRTDGFTVSLVRRNGVNSEYLVVEPSGYVVLAIKTNVRNPWRTRRRSYPVIYVPYSAPLHTPEMAERGRDYLIGLLDRAADRLDASSVESFTRDGVLVSEMAPERVLLAILVVEHITPWELSRQGEDAVIGEVLVTVGLNMEATYGYAGSRAGAQGLAQFIRRTYRSVRHRYRGAALHGDFISGMMDHENAAMAQYCLADWIMDRISPDRLDILMQSEREEDLGAYIAASYNAGAGTVRNAMDRHPRNWERPGNGLPRETSTYVRTFRTVYRYLFPQ